jgi:hypothetical protein
MLLSLTAAALAAGATCQVDRQAAMRLDEQQFDQDIHGGWRALDDRGCKAEAADLIRAYRLANNRRNDGTLLWHEGQVRAGIGQISEAVGLFIRTKKPAAADVDGWNYYVDGTVAFLHDDRRGLLRAREALAALPPPKTPETLSIDGKVVQLPWPPNLNVLDGLLKCFGQPYEQAYACAEPFLKVEILDKR